MAGYHQAQMRGFGNFSPLLILIYFLLDPYSIYLYNILRLTFCVPRFNFPYTK